MKQNRIICTLILLLTFNLSAQEVIVPLTFDLKLLKENAKKKKDVANEKSMVTLPFIDDFSTDKSFNNPDGNPVHWAESCARRNETFAINAPSIGVMTFDGLDCAGYPYDFENNSAYGVADTLESVAIDLSSTSGLVVMSFFFQPQGWGNPPQGIDSLVLEFYEPATGLWHWVWSAPGTPLTEFQQVLLPIDNLIFLHEEFKFRFKNYAKLSGAFDHWHLDYIEIDDNRSLTDTINQDLAFFEPANSLINLYSSVPWNHFDEDLMKEDILIQIKNNGNSGSFQSNNLLEVFESGVSQGSSLNSSGEPSVGAGSIQAYNYDVSAAGISYDTTIPDEATFNVEFSYAVSPDFIMDNNTLKFEQNFSDYYAYDDGSAEAGYGVNDAGGQVAYKFDFLQSDSISALYMYFLPRGIDPSDEQFFLTVWSHNEDLNCPDTIIQQSSIAAPSYVDYQNAPDYFLVYPLEEKVFVDAFQTVWVGWQQSGEKVLNIGYDFNTNSSDRIKFKTIGPWNSSNFEGSLMIRPAVGSIPVVNVDEISESDINVYPNPSNGIVYFELPQTNSNWNYEVFNISGQIIAQDQFINKTLDLSQSKNGLYWIRLSNPYLSRPITKKIVLVR